MLTGMFRALHRLLSCPPLTNVAPEIRITISLTSSTFRLSDDERPSIVVETTLASPQVLTVNCRGERDAGTILGTPTEHDFRVENFIFRDASTSEPVEHELFPGSCEPGMEFLELHAGKPRVTRKLLDEVDPLSDPVNLLKPGRIYHIMLRPQSVKCWNCGVNELLAQRTPKPPPEGHEGSFEYEYPQSQELTVASQDKLTLKIEK